MSDYRIIDAHCHIYPDKIASKASGATGKFYNIAMRYNGTVSELLNAGKSAGISHYVVQSVATKPEQVSSINHFISDSVKNSNGTMTGLGTLHPDSQDIKSDVEEILSLGLHGVKLHPDIQGFNIDDEKCLAIYKLCEGRLPILFHCGDKRYDYSSPKRLSRILDMFCDLHVVAAHFGGYCILDQALSVLPKYKNLYVDCSSVFFSMTDDEIKNAIRTYGADRVMFGTDYPMWEPKKEIERLLSLGYSEKEYKLIFEENAIKAFGLSI